MLLLFGMQAAVALPIATCTCSSSLDDLKANAFMPDAGSGDVAPCNKKTCGELDADCGETLEGCGGILQCGSCSEGLFCGGTGPNECGTAACIPRSCTSLGCGGTLDCGGCSGYDSCGGSGTANVCGRSPQPYCYSQQCDYEFDGFERDARKALATLDPVPQREALARAAAAGDEVDPARIYPYLATAPYFESSTRASTAARSRARPLPGHCRRPRPGRVHRVPDGSSPARQRRRSPRAGADHPRARCEGAQDHVHRVRSSAQPLDVARWTGVDGGKLFSFSTV